MKKNAAALILLLFHLSPCMPAIHRIPAAVLLCAALAASPAHAVSADNAKRIEDAVASCRGDPQCEVAMRKRETLAAEKREKQEAEDRALKERAPFTYYLTLLGRFLLFAVFVAGAAGLYVLVMHLLFDKKRRKSRAGSDTHRDTPPASKE